VKAATGVTETVWCRSEDTFSHSVTSPVTSRRNDVTGDVFAGLTTLRLLDTDSFKFCCISPSGVERCRPPADEFSSCEDLMANDALQKRRPAGRHLDPWSDGARRKRLRRRVANSNYDDDNNNYYTTAATAETYTTTDKSLRSLCFES